MIHSIRFRLLLGLTVVIISIWVLVVIATYHGAKSEVRALFDTQLEQSARVAMRTLLGLPTANDEIKPESTISPPEAEQEQHAQYRKNLVVQVWNDKGELFLHSQDAPLFPLSTVRAGFANSMINDTIWRTFSFEDKAHGLTIQAGEPYSVRDYLTQHVVIQTLYPIIIGLPIVTLLIWFAVGKGLTPLRKLAKEVGERDPDNLASIRAPYAPNEVQPLVDELNSLLQRLDDKIEKERRFTGDAAHELRTPLAGLKAQAEVALGARNKQERQKALTNISTGVDRASHLVDQLLTLSRLDESASIDDGNVNLLDTVRTVIADLLPYANEKSTDISLEHHGQGQSWIRGNKEAMYILLRNLVDNAIRYSPEHSLVTVSLGRRDDSNVIAVQDQGQGIPVQDRQRVFDRFHRRSNSEAYGTGLGLSIVKRVIDLHNGKVTLRQGTNGSGLSVEVMFPSVDIESASDPLTTTEPSIQHSARADRLATEH
ncbi:MAG: ATP-binding protein [Gammaproteobacteria bacterium]|nr:ATP-binding protein [Gammaproteobacteria bacterium]